MNKLRRKLLVVALLVILASFALLAIVSQPFVDLGGGGVVAAETQVDEPTTLFLPVVVYSGEPPNQCYKLTVSHSGNGSDPVASPVKSPVCAQDGTYIYNAIVTLGGATPDANWHISSWSGTLNDPSTAASNTVAMPAGDYAAAVNYVEDCFKLTLTHTGNGSDPVAAPTKSDTCTEEGAYVPGEVIQLSGAVPAADWHIAGWSGTDNDVSSAASNVVTMPTANRTAAVNYEETCYTLTVGHKGNGSDPVASPAQCAQSGTYVAGAAIQFSGAVPASDSFIAGWSGTDDDLSMAATNTATMPSDALTVTVNYELKNCSILTLTHTGNGTDPVVTPVKSKICAQGGSFIEGEQIQLSGAVPDPGWPIGSWTGTDNDASTADTNGLTMPAGPHTVAVNYEGICFKLTLGHTGQGNNPSASPISSTGCGNGEFHAGEVIQLSGANPSNGWHISSWMGTENDSSTASSNSLTMPASTHTAEVNYEQSCYTLTLTHAGSGSDPVASPANSSGCANGEYHYLENIQLSGAVPDLNWYIQNWLGTDSNNSTSSTNIVTMPANNHTAAVNYNIVCYRLTLNHSGQGSDPVALPIQSSGCSSDRYVQGEVIALSGAVPDTHWYIFSWTGTDADGSTASTNSLSMPAGAHTAAVNYQIDCYPLTVGHTGNGSTPTASPASSSGCQSGQYVAGESIQLTGAVPATDWYIASWTGTTNDNSMATTNTVTMPASAHSAVVNYLETCYVLTLTHTGDGSDPVANPTKSAQCANAGEFVYQEAISLLATPAAQNRVASWTGTANDSSIITTNSLSMPASNHAASVNYELNCNLLTVGHTGEGSDPAASPAQSNGCVANYYLEGESITLTGAVPASGWQIAGWSGTDNDSSMADNNTVTMPGTAHTASVNYTEI